MSSLSIEKFKEHVENQNDDFMRDGKNVEGVICGSFFEEKSIIFPLTCAWKAGVVTEFKHKTNVEMAIAQLGNRLSQEYGLRESAAITALRVWAYALGTTDVVPNININSISSTSPTSIVSETKECPFCAEEVKKNALICKHCHSDISNGLMDKEAQNSEPSGPVFRKTSVLFVFFMSIITPGIYWPIWFYRRRNAINSLQSKEKLNSGILFDAFLFAIVSFWVLGVGDGFGSPVLLNLGVWLLLLVQSLKVRGILREHFNDYLKMDVKFSWLATFFFQIIYLQYKMNRVSTSSTSVSSAYETEDGKQRHNKVQVQVSVPEEHHHSESTSLKTKDSDSLMTFTIKGVSFNMVRAPAGEFMMGSPDSEPHRFENEGPQHLVRISLDFWMGETQVTQRLWNSVMRKNPAYFKNGGVECPMEQVSWNDCQKFIKKLNGMVATGNFRLPNEAEWEYACRAGTTGIYSGDLADMGWSAVNSSGINMNVETIFRETNNDSHEFYRILLDSGCRTHPVASKRPNAWGLYDMHGNVAEWCQDFFGEYPSGKVTDPIGPSTGFERVYRGGSWGSDAVRTRSAYRGHIDNKKYSEGSYFDGLRLVWTY
jgi:formylglycine-generating enzyme required for sulfatase activity